MAKASVKGIDSHIGQRLKSLRQQQGISAATLAEAIDATQQQISRYETGQNKMSAAQLYAISHALDVPVSWFFMDYANDNKMLPIRESTRPDSVYSASAIEEELKVIKSHWPELTPHQRSSILRLLDTFLLR